jgi:hypothetical protein
MADVASTPRVFATKPFMRFARRFDISESELWQAVNGDYDADLGGGVFKFRLARHGEGTSGGSRAIVAMRAGHRIVMMFGFEKKDMDNIKPGDLSGFRKAARVYLSFSEEEIKGIVRNGALTEIVKPLRGKGDRHGKGI